MLVPDSPRTPAGDTGAIVTATIVVLGFLYGLVRWPLVAFLQWHHRRIGLIVWVVELKANAQAREDIAALTGDVATLTTRVDVVEKAIKAFAEHADELPQIRRIAERGLETAERTERMMDGISKQVLETSVAIGEIKGALSRSVGQTRA